MHRKLKPKYGVICLIKNFRRATLHGELNLNVNKKQASEWPEREPRCQLTHEQMGACHMTYKNFGGPRCNVNRNKK